MADQSTQNDTIGENNFEMLVDAIELEMTDPIRAKNDMLNSFFSGENAKQERVLTKPKNGKSPGLGDIY